MSAENNETEINTRFDVLIQQRNNALNQNVIDAGVIATLREKIQVQDSRIAELENLQLDAGALADG